MLLTAQQHEIAPIQQRLHGYRLLRAATSGRHMEGEVELTIAKDLNSLLAGLQCNDQAITQAHFAQVMKHTHWVTQRAQRLAPRTGAITHMQRMSSLAIRGNQHTRVGLHTINSHIDGHTELTVTI
jgi:hypothetical protein